MDDGGMTKTFAARTPRKTRRTVSAPAARRSCWESDRSPGLKGSAHYVADDQPEAVAELIEREQLPVLSALEKPSRVSKFHMPSLLIVIPQSQRGSLPNRRQPARTPTARFFLRACSATHSHPPLDHGFPEIDAVGKPRCPPK